METHKALRVMDTSQLNSTRKELDYIHRNHHTPDHVRHAAAVLLNFYGSEIDARMSKGITD